MMIAELSPPSFPEYCSGALHKKCCGRHKNGAKPAFATVRCLDCSISSTLKAFPAMETLSVNEL
jgi:hypothetical protein